MKLIDLEPVSMGERRRPGQGIAFNCPGPCCEVNRRKQEAANAAEAAGAPDARELRIEAESDQPYRVWVAFTEAMITGSDLRKTPALDAEVLYTRTGTTLDDLTIAEDIDRRDAGHVLMRISGGEVTVI